MRSKKPSPRQGNSARPRAGEKQRRAARRSYHHGDLPRALMDEAVRVVRERGPGGLSLRELTRRVGVSHAAPYRHFGGSRDVLEAVAVEGFGILRERLEEAVALAGPSPVARLQEMGVAYVRFAVDWPAHFEVMFSPHIADRSKPTPVREAKDATYAVLAGVVEACVAAGHVAAEADSFAATLAAWSLVHGLGTLCKDGYVRETASSLGDAPVEAVARVVTRQLLDGLVASKRRRRR